jgi:hypothetical protein
MEMRQCSARELSVGSHVGHPKFLISMQRVLHRIVTPAYLMLCLGLTILELYRMEESDSFVRCNLVFKDCELHRQYA